MLSRIAMYIGASCFQRVAGSLAGFRRHIKKYILPPIIYNYLYLVIVFVCGSIDIGRTEYSLPLLKKKRDGAVMKMGKDGGYICAHQLGITQ
jgi:hypothetical protein